MSKSLRPHLLETLVLMQLARPRIFGAFVYQLQNKLTLMSVVAREVPVVTLRRIPARDVRSLAWDGDVLVDWAAGEIRYQLDGNTGKRLWVVTYMFDAAQVSPSGEYSVIFTRLGTKGLVLRRGRIIREINRSYYCAGHYEYPLALFQLPDGREVMAHCPDAYNRLEIDDLATGERLTVSTTRNPADYFPSRLAASSDGRWLLSAGWVWHPLDVVAVFNVANALENPLSLDGLRLGIDAWAEESSAVFIDNRRLLVALEGIDYEAELDDRQIGEYGEFRLFDLAAPDEPRISYPQAPVGTMMALGKHFVLGLYEHPRLFNIQTGEVLLEWPDIRSGRQYSSLPSDDIPPIALDALNRRCAIFCDDAIHVLHFADT